jgi:hypothetical protein
MSDPARVEVWDDVPLLVETADFNASQLELAIEEWIEGKSLEELTPILHRLQVATKALGAAHHAVAVAVGSKMSSKNLIVNGVTLERGSPSGGDQWGVEDVLDHLYARARDERQMDEETGEYESDGSALLRLVKECAGIQYFRKGKKGDDPGPGLRAHGLDPDEFLTPASGPRKAKVLDA